MIRVFWLVGGLFLGVTCSLHSPGLQATETFPLILEGKNGFQYYLVTDEENKPVFSQEGSPIYQGISSSSELYVELPYRQLLKGGYLKDSEEYFSTSWASKTHFIQIPPSMFAEILRYYQDNKEAFFKLFQGMTTRKAELFYSLLFEKKLRLTSQDLQEIQRNAFNPHPAPLLIPLPIAGESVWSDLFHIAFPWTIEIQMEEIQFEFSEKIITFDPQTNSFKINLILQNVEFQGPVREIGEVRYLPIRYWDRSSLLKKGELHNAVLELTFSLKMETENFWRFILKEPLDLKFIDLDPKTTLVYQRKVDEKVVEKEHNISLTPQIQNIIQTTLSSAIEGLLKKGIFSTAWGGILPLSSFTSNHEKRGQSALQNRLSLFQVEADGIQLGFDSRVVVPKISSCVSAFLSPFEFQEEKGEGMVEGLDKKEQSQTEQSQTEWKMVSRFLEQNSHGLNSHGLKSKTWQLTEPVSSPTDFVHLKAKPAVFEQMSYGFYTAGLYCLSTKEWWPRPSYIPLIDFIPKKVPMVTLEENRLDFILEGALQTYQRSGDTVEEKFIPLQPMEVKLSLPFELDNATGAWKLTPPQSISFSNFSPQENEFMAHWADVLWMGLEENTLLFNNLKNFPFIQSQKLRPEGLTLEIHKDWLLSLSESSGEDPPPPVAEPSLPLPQTILEVQGVQRVTTPFITIQWKGNSPDLFFSWRWRLYPENWSSWAPFQKETEWVHRLEKPGRYEFQIKAMDRYFVIEKVPAIYEIFYEGETTKAEKETPSVIWSTPSETSPSAPSPSSPAAKKAESKGPFGCALSVSVNSDGRKNFWWLFLILGMGYWILKVLNFHISYSRFRLFF